MRKLFIGGKERVVVATNKAELESTSNKIGLYIAYERYFGPLLVYVGAKSQNHYESVVAAFALEFGADAELICVQICT